MRIKNKTSLVISLICLCVTAYAEDEVSRAEAKSVPEVKKLILPVVQRYVIKDESRIKAVVGMRVQNRFQIKDSKIHEVIGQGFLYKIVSDETGSHVFITPGGAANGPNTDRIDLTLIYDDGKACDLTLIVNKDQISRSILLLPEDTFFKDTESNLLRQQERKGELQQMLKAMLKDRKGKYDKEIVLKRLPDYIRGQERFELVVDRRFGWAASGLKGLRIRIRNISGDLVLVNEDLIRRAFEDTEMVHITKPELASGEQEVVYVIRNDNRFGQNGERY